VLTVLLAAGLAVAGPRAIEIDFEAVEIVGERPDPLVLVAEPQRPEAEACAHLLTLGLPELPSIEGLGTRAGRRMLVAAARAAELDADARDLALAKAHTCFAWTYGDARTTAGLYAWFVRQADLGYCREHVTAYHGLVPEDFAERTALDEATAFDEYCVAHPGTPEWRRNPYEKVQTALSEARMGTFLPGGAAGGLYRRVVRRTDDTLTPKRFLSVLRDLDASGAPAAEFVAGDSDRVWKAREVERAAVERLGDPAR